MVRCQIGVVAIGYAASYAGLVLDRQEGRGIQCGPRARRTRRRVEKCSRPSLWRDSPDQRRTLLCGVQGQTNKHILHQILSFDATPATMNAADDSDSIDVTKSSSPRNRINVLLRNHLKRLQSSPTETLLLDGGTGEELFLRGVPDDRKIWSATAIVNEQFHSIVEDVHKSFIDAGSQAITTNSYGITPGVGFTDGEEVKRLVGVAGDIARRVVTPSTSSHPVALVLGSLGPQVESYRPDLILKHDDGVRAYQYAVQGLYPYIDVYLAETMSCLEEAFQATDAISKFYSGLNDPNESLKHPLLVSFTLDRDGNIRDGEPAVEVVPKLIRYAHDKKVERKFFHFLVADLYSRPNLIHGINIK